MNKTYFKPHGRIYNIYEDMIKQYHLLISGTTGSGKTTVIDGIISTILYNYPWDAELILLDPKRIELAGYKNVPHVIRYASESDDMLNALKYAVKIVDDRCIQMQRHNERFFSGGDIYIIIDDFDGLISKDKKQALPLIKKLSENGRAAKTHLIISAQTVIAKVIPTEIKCAIDSVVGLRTSTAQDSRNVIGYSGLEFLPEYGECIYKTPSKEGRWKLPYIDETERKRLVDWWVNQK